MTRIWPGAGVAVPLAFAMLVVAGACGNPPGRSDRAGEFARLDSAIFARIVDTLSTFPLVYGAGDLRVDPRIFDNESEVLGQGGGAREFTAAPRLPGPAAHRQAHLQAVGVGETDAITMKCGIPPRPCSDFGHQSLAVGPPVPAGVRSSSPVNGVQVYRVLVSLGAITWSGVTMTYNEAWLVAVRTGGRVEIMVLPQPTVRF